MSPAESDSLVFQSTNLNITEFQDMYIYISFPGGGSGKEPACQCTKPRDVGSIPGWGRPPGGGHGNPLQYSCLVNPMDGGPWWAMVHRVTKSRT